MSARGHWTERLPGGQRPDFAAWLWPGITAGLLLLWIIGSGLGALVFLSEGIGAPILAIVLATVGVGIATLVLPMRGAHLRIRAEKRAELERTRTAIRGEREKLLADSARPARLADLLAYEARIERVREWPIDLPILLRFSGLLALAVGSWLGGAVVERVLALLW
jgi:hypothetical protein